ncbi:trypsin-like serine protease [Massilia sp. SR12]
MANPVIKKLLGLVLALGAIGSASAADMHMLPGAKPMISSGAAPDSPDNRIDPNLPSSRFSGVVSLAVQYDGGTFICSGTLVGKRQVVTAGHCVDTNNKGALIDLKKPGSSVHVIFNATDSGPGSDIIRASQVSMHADYNGFNYCPNGSRGCLNDDLAVVTLSKDAPANAKIYKVASGELQAGTRIIMAGYGTSGDGVKGYYVDPDFFVKRSGQNYVDAFASDDEKKGRHPEVWYADFDGNGIDTFCDWGVACSPVLANDVEAGIGGGDSGGPSFVEMYGELMLIATNTFGNSAGLTEGTFGTYFGGMVLKSYLDYLYQATGGAVQFVPEPASTAMFGLGLLALAGARRRKQLQ